MRPSIVWRIGARKGSASARNWPVDGGAGLELRRGVPECRRRGVATPARRIMGVSPDEGPGSEKRTLRFLWPGVLGTVASAVVSSVLIETAGVLRRERRMAMGKSRSSMFASDMFASDMLTSSPKANDKDSFGKNARVKNRERANVGADGGDEMSEDWPCFVWQQAPQSRIQNNDVALELSSSLHRDVSRKTMPLTRASAGCCPLFTYFLSRHSVRGLCTGPAPRIFCIDHELTASRCGDFARVRDMACASLDPFGGVYVERVDVVRHGDHGCCGFWQVGA